MILHQVGEVFVLGNPFEAGLQQISFSIGKKSRKCHCNVAFSFKLVYDSASGWVWKIELLTQDSLLIKRKEVRNETLLELVVFDWVFLIGRFRVTGIINCVLLQYLHHVAIFRNLWEILIADSYVAVVLVVTFQIVESVDHLLTSNLELRISRRCTTGNNDEFCKLSRQKWKHVADGSNVLHKIDHISLVGSLSSVSAIHWDHWMYPGDKHLLDIRQIVQHRRNRSQLHVVRCGEFVSTGTTYRTTVSFHFQVWKFAFTTCAHNHWIWDGADCVVKG